MRPSGHLVYKRRLLLWAALTFLLSSVAVCEFENTKEIKIGVLAKRGSAHALAKWGPTADYLTKSIEEYSFKIVPLEFEDIYSAAESQRVEFILSNSSFYVGLEMLHGMNRIVTLKNLGLKKGYTVFGGVIFCKANRKDIIGLDDLNDQSFMAVQEKSLGGWQMAWLELKNKGIDPHKDFSEIKFGGTHDSVVYAVAEGKVDAGTVRTDTLERMQEEGKINLNDFRILNQQVDHIDFPYVRSTRLYPEWPLAKARHTSDKLAEEVASALLRMSPDSKAAKAAKCAGWTIPHNYQAVHECLKTLRLGPYKDYGKVTLSEVFTKYWLFILLVILGVILLCIFTLYVIRLNQRLNKAQLELKKHRDNLERLVGERTEELRLERDKLRTIFETMDDGIYIVNQNYDVEYLNSSIIAEFDSLEERKCYSYFHNMNKVCPWCKNSEVFEGKTIKWELVSPKNGKTYDIIETPLNNVDGTVSKLAIIRDITDRKQVDKEREDLLKTLTFRNKELQSIVYIASHDLKSPLVNLHGFGGELDKHCTKLTEYLRDATLNPDIKSEIERLIEEYIPESLKFIKSSTVKMKGLLDGLLHVSRVGSVDIHKNKVDMNALLESIVTTMQFQIEAFSVSISIDELPSCFGDSGLINQVFSNLIENSLKYLNPDRKGIIHISGHTEEGLSIYCVEDNGIGINQKYEKKVFEVFHRLYPNGPVSGEGLGLTIASRILDRHNGRIWFESEAGKGCNFYVSLPTGRG